MTGEPTQTTFKVFCTKYINYHLKSKVAIMLRCQQLCNQSSQYEKYGNFFHYKEEAIMCNH